MHTEDVKSILAYALLDRIWHYLNRSMPIGAARLDALASVTTCERALLENWATFSDRATIASFNMLTSKGRNISDTQSDRIRADIARLSPSRTIATDEELQAEIDALSPEDFAILRTLKGYTPEGNEHAK